MYRENASNKLNLELRYLTIFSAVVSFSKSVVPLLMREFSGEKFPVSKMVKPPNSGHAMALLVPQLTMALMLSLFKRVEYVNTACHCRMDFIYFQHSFMDTGNIQGCIFCIIRKPKASEQLQNF